MNPIWKQIVTQVILKKDGEAYSDFKMAKGFRELRMTLLGILKDAALILVGVFSAAFGFKGFLLTNHFIDGGATGISLLISAVTSIPLYILIICINIPFV